MEGVLSGHEKEGDLMAGHCEAGVFRDQTFLSVIQGFAAW